VPVPSSLHSFFLVDLRALRAASFYAKEEHATHAAQDHNNTRGLVKASLMARNEEKNYTILNRLYLENQAKCMLPSYHAFFLICTTNTSAVSKEKPERPHLVMNIYLI
jgi:hypothetical protein